MSPQAGTTSTVFKTFVFTDLVGSTDLKRRIGDVAGAEAIGRHDELFHQCLREFEGGDCKDIGDGFLVSFDVPSDAVRCALAFQQRLGAIDSHESLKVRIGIHAGESVLLDRKTPDGEERKLVGLAVDTAARVMGLAQGGQILLTRGAFDSARQQVLSAPDGSAVRWLAHGTYLFQGLDDPLEVFELGIEGLSPLAPPPDSEKANRVLTPGEEDTLGWRPAAGLKVPRRENWILGEKLGEGGYGEVWLAEHAKTRSKRVFKFCFDSERVRGLRREVVLFRLLKETLGDRPDIVRILDWEFERSPFFLESEYTAAGDLARWAQAKGGIESIPLRTRLELVAQTAVALGAAHSVGVLHKDVKPANILITEITDSGEPRACLTDFGIGLITSREALKAGGVTLAGLTQTLLASSATSYTGTPLYMAPEVIESKPATTLSDIYSLGVVLYQMAIGDFSRGVAPGWERDVEDEFLREDIAACVDGVPERRLASAAELAERLRGLAKRRADREAQRRELREAEAAKKAAEKVRRRWKYFSAAALAGAVALVGAIVFALHEKDRAAEQTLLRERADQARNTAQYMQYVFGIQNGAIQLERGNVDLASKALAAVPAWARNWEWGFLWGRARPREQEASGVSAAVFEPDAATAEIWENASPQVSLVLEGHSAQVDSVHFSADGTAIVTGSSDGTAKVWDAATGEERMTLRGGAPIHAVRFSHDGRWIATGDLVHETIVWNLATGEKQFTFVSPDDAISAVRFSADDSLIAVLTLDGTIRAWELDSGEQLAVIEGEPAQIGFAFEFVGEGARVIANWGPDQVKTWDLTLSTEESTITAPAGSESSIVAFDVPRGRVASRHDDGRVSVWTMDGELAVAFSPGRATGRASVDFSADGTCIATASDDNTVRLWDARTGEELLALRGYPVSSLETARFAADGARLAIPDKEHTVRIVVPGARAAADPDLLVGHSDPVFLLRYSPDGSRLLSASFDGTLKLWDAATGTQLATLEGHTAEPINAVFDRGGDRVLSVSWDGTTRLWNAHNGEALSTRQIGVPPRTYGGGPRGPIHSVMAGNRAPTLFSPDGRRYIGLGRETGNAVVVDVKTGRTLFTLPSGDVYVGSYLYGPGGARLLTLAHPSSRMTGWSGQDGSRLYTLEGHEGFVVHVEFSPDGSKICTTSVDGTTRVWAANDGAAIATLEGHEVYCNNAHFDPSSALIVTSSHDRTAKIWEAQSGEELATLVGHQGDVMHAAFSPDSSRVLTASLDNTVRVWDVQGHELVTLDLGGRLYHAVWSPDGLQIATALHDGTVRVWRAIDWKGFELDQGNLHDRVDVNLEIDR